jgi:undecaprenyl-diphosphatase
MNGRPTSALLQPWADRPRLAGRRWWPLPRRDRAPALVVAGLGLLLSGLLVAVAVVSDERAMDARDRGLNLWFRNLGRSSGLLHQVAETVSWVGSGARTGPLVLTVCLVLFLLKQWRWSVFLLLSAEVGYLISDSIKLAVGRVRPPWHYFPPLELRTSFPSGHTFGGMTAWVAMGLVAWFLLPRAWSTLLGPLCWTVGLLNGPSRLLLAKHWVTDVVGGWLMGTGWLLVVAGVCLWQWAPGSPRDLAVRRAADDEPPGAAPV